MTIVFFWFGKDERSKHMDSHHRRRSKCSLCVHFKCVHLRDLAVGCGIGMLISLRVLNKFVCLFLIFALLMRSGDIETNPGPPCKLAQCLNLAT